MRMTTSHDGENIGCLSDPLAQLAIRIVQIIATRVSTVWVDDLSEVFVAVEAPSRTLPPHWLVGTYTCGVPARDIEDDLRAVLAERARDWIIS